MSKKVLICDDEVYIHLLIKSALKKYDFEFLEAEDGNEAVKLAKSDLPSLIIIDYKMPKMDGYEAIKEIKMDELTEKIPIIMLTGINIDPSLKEAIDLEVDAYLVKPFSISELIETIEKVLENSL